MLGFALSWERGMRGFGWLVVLVMIVVVTEAHASSRRVALVIGNSAYQRVFDYRIQLAMRQPLPVFCGRPDSTQ